MGQEIKEDTNIPLNTKNPIGSYEAMKPWFDRVDSLHEEFLKLEREGLLEDKNENQ